MSYRVGGTASASNEDDVQLARLLGFEEIEFLRVAGGPWYQAQYDGERTGHYFGHYDAERPGGRGGLLFVGRAGPSVALLVEIGTAGKSLTAGPAKGSWQGVYSLSWRVDEPHTVLQVPFDPMSNPEFVDRLRTAVDRAAAIRTPLLRVCRYCGTLKAPELSFDADTCYGCASAIHGVVY